MTRELIPVTPGPADEVRSDGTPLVFVVGTGRTGSTVLSEILARHGGVLSLSEFFTALRGFAALQDEYLTGPEYWAVLAEPHPAFSAMLRQGVTLPEFSYLQGGRRRRFSVDDGVPTICLMTLPLLSDDPDAVFDRLADTVPSWGRNSLAGHHRRLFATLQDMFGGSVVVERSGHSLEWVGALRKMFPTALFIHMHRYGPDCALSMSRHAGYRTAALLGEIMEHAGVSTPAEIDEMIVDRLPQDLADLWRADFLTAFTMDRVVPTARYGVLWSSMVKNGLSLLAGVPAERKTSLAYEDLLANPGSALERIAAFIGVPAPPEWIRHAEEVLDVARSGSAHRLPAAERNALVAACAPGLRLLALEG